jgi:CubicO group peptidase (beta-lactamase class C family)
MKSKSAVLMLMMASILFIFGCDATTIEGTVTLNSQPLTGITVQADTNGTIINTQTNTSGDYSLVINAGSGTSVITPISNNYTFIPPSQVINLAGGTVSNVDFSASGSPIAPLPDRLQGAIDTIVANDNPNDPLGISAAVYKKDGNNDFSWQGVAGLQEVGGAPVTNTMLFGIGSITKTFISALVLTYAEDPNNPLDLTDTIGCAPSSGCAAAQVLGKDCWLAENELPSASYIPRNITVEELLFQTSGLREDPNLMDLALNRYSANQLIKQHSTPTGTKITDIDSRYCNLNYTILGVILEKVKPTVSVAQQLNDLLNARGLVLPDTYMTYPGGFPAGRQLVRGHGWIGFPSYLTGLPNDIPFAWRNENDPFVQQYLNNITDEEIMRLSNYAGSMVSTAQDLAKWAKALYEDTGSGASRILSKANRDRMLTNIQGYGAGCRVYTTSMVGHGGSNYIYIGLMQYDLLNNEAAVNLFNRNDPDLRFDINQELFNELHR